MAESVPPKLPVPKRSSKVWLTKEIKAEIQTLIALEIDPICYINSCFVGRADINDQAVFYAAYLARDLPGARGPWPGMVDAVDHVRAFRRLRVTERAPAPQFNATAFRPVRLLDRWRQITGLQNAVQDGGTAGGCFRATPPYFEPDRLHFFWRDRHGPFFRYFDHGPAMARTSTGFKEYYATSNLVRYPLRVVASEAFYGMFILAVSKHEPFQLYVRRWYATTFAAGICRDEPALSWGDLTREQRKLLQPWLARLRVEGHITVDPDIQPGAGTYYRLVFGDELPLRTVGEVGAIDTKAPRKLKTQEDVAAEEDEHVKNEVLGIRAMIEH